VLLCFIIFVTSALPIKFQLSSKLRGHVLFFTSTAPYSQSANTCWRNSI
jgi:hypothetical protein